jgi:diadenylate cyclase
MESSCSDNSPEMNEIKKSFTNIYERITAFASYLGEDDIDILKELKTISTRFSDASKTLSTYYMSQLLLPYTNKCHENFKVVRQLSSQRKGALIVVQREDQLDHLITKGTSLNAKISSSLLDTVFHVGGPLHDGAVLIQNDIIVSAANVLPLTKKTYKREKLGTRHRAAIGLSELSDALIFMVSEETGKESFLFPESSAQFFV